MPCSARAKPPPHRGQLRFSAGLTPVTQKRRSQCEHARRSMGASLSGPDRVRSPDRRPVTAIVLSRRGQRCLSRQPADLPPHDSEASWAGALRPLAPVLAGLGSRGSAVEPSNPLFAAARLRRCRSERRGGVLRRVMALLWMGRPSGSQRPLCLSRGFAQERVRKGIHARHPNG